MAYMSCSNTMHLTWITQHSWLEPGPAMVGGPPKLLAAHHAATATATKAPQLTQPMKACSFVCIRAERTQRAQCTRWLNSKCECRPAEFRVTHAQHAPS
eukprot:365025-Chlamydomonas_euryale.AAC.12